MLLHTEFSWQHGQTGWKICLGCYEFLCVGSEKIYLFSLFSALVIHELVFLCSDYNTPLKENEMLFLNELMSEL